MAGKNLLGEILESLFLSCLSTTDKQTRPEAETSTNAGCPQSTAKDRIIPGGLLSVCVCRWKKEYMMELANVLALRSTDVVVSTDSLGSSS